MKDKADRSPQRRASPAPLIYRERDLPIVTSLSRQAREDEMRKGTFPKPIPLSTRAKGWLVSEIQDWLEGRKALRDQDAA